MNPLAATINEGEEIIARLNETSEQLEACIADERSWHTRCKDALDAYEVAETEELAEVVIMAHQKEGPLGGIAVSGKGYDIVLTKLKNDLRKGKLAHLWASAERIRRSYEMSQVELAQVEARFKALRIAAEVKTQVLRASTI
jgi:hypothetical protein